MSCILIAGLGNPGVKYRKTRHNIGFMVLEALALHLGLAFKSSSRFKAELATTQANGAKLFLLKPQTFMNLSGESIAPFIRYHHIAHALVIHDELDCALGDIRFKFGGSSGGHNGLKSIDSHFGSEYFRLRFGISRPQTQSVIEYVLGDFTPSEAQELDELIEYATNACLAFISRASDLPHQMNAPDSKCGAKRANDTESKRATPSPTEREILNFLQNGYTRKARPLESRRESKQASKRDTQANFTPTQESSQNPKRDTRLDSKRDFAPESKPTPKHAQDSKQGFTHNSAQDSTPRANQAPTIESKVLESHSLESQVSETLESNILESRLDSKDSIHSQTSTLPHPAGESQ